MCLKFLRINYHINMIVCIGNHLISTAIWDKSAQVNFSEIRRPITFDPLSAAQMKVTSPQANPLHVTQTPGQAVTLGQQMSISAGQSLSAAGIKAVVSTTDRPLQGVYD